jgi:hypothetical protein
VELRLLYLTVTSSSCREKLRWHNPMLATA